jgi:hypothetical protein
LQNEKDPTVVETKHFLNFWLLVRSVKADSPTRKALLTRVENDLQKEPPFIRRQYQGMLDSLKARISPKG